MTEEPNGEPAPNDSDGAPVDRRDFLRSVAAGVALDRTVVEGVVGRDSEVRPTGRDGRLASQHTPVSRRGYLPVESNFVSVRGLAPAQGTNAGGNVWRSGVFSASRTSRTSTTSTATRSQSGSCGRHSSQRTASVSWVAAGRTGWRIMSSQTPKT